MSYSGLTIVGWTLIWLQFFEELNQVFVPLLQNISAGEESFVCITAADVLCEFGCMKEGISILANGIGSKNPYNSLMAARAFA